jgi:hypothetical protein
MKRYLPLLLLATAGCDAMSAHTDVVARAGQHELTVDGLVEMLAGNPQIPPQTEVVASVADLWVDYTILAELAAEDTTLADLDLQPMVEPYIEQRTFMQLRDQVVTQDTMISDEELRQLFQDQAPGLRIRARHVLVEYPQGATDGQRDSVRALADDIRERAVAGEDFAGLARQYSADPGSAQQGGDLGWFERGRMVRPFEDAAFALSPGEVSEVVETPFGLHVIRVEERETPSFDEMGDDFRQRAIGQRRQESLNTYVDSLREPVSMEIQQGAYDVARDLAGNPTERLAGRAANRQLVSWTGGELTAREFVDVIRRMPPQQRAQFASMPDEQLERVLEDVSTNELVLADARTRGISVPETEQDSIRTLIREQLADLAKQAGLTGGAQEGETGTDAVARRVRGLLEGILAGRQNLLPLGALPYVLRNEMEWHIAERTFPEVVEQLQERREEQSQLQPTPALPGPGQGQVPGGQPNVEPVAPPQTPADSGAGTGG